MQSDKTSQILWHINSPLHLKWKQPTSSEVQKSVPVQFYYCYSPWLSEKVNISEAETAASRAELIRSVDSTEVRGETHYYPLWNHKD